MKKFISFRNIIILCLIISGFVFYIYNLIPHSEPSQYAFTPSQIFPEDNKGAGEEADGSANSDLPLDNTAGSQLGADLKIKVRDSSICLGESAEDVVKKLGSPGRIDESEYNFDYYIYNNDYSRLLCIAVADGRVVGLYTDSLDFDYMGVKSGTDLSTLQEIFNKDYGLTDIIEHETEDYRLQIFIDSLESHLVTGIYLLSKATHRNEYSLEAMRSLELIVYDLTNSIRVRHNLPVLSWSSSAALACRKHSLDMAVNDFFSHKNIKRELPEDRLRAEGIFVISHSENLVAGYDNAFLSVHKLYNSRQHRNNILDKRIRYTGVGFAYEPDSKYGSYITQLLYR